MIDGWIDGFIVLPIDFRNTVTFVRKQGFIVRINNRTIWTAKAVPTPQNYNNYLHICACKRICVNVRFITARMSPELVNFSGTLA